MISVVIPCMNEEEAIPIFYTEFQKIMDKMSFETFELIFIDDGSSDSTLSVMKELAKKDERVKYISFSRNFGKEAAMYAGLKNSIGDYVVIMDVDLQDPPHLLPEMYSAIVDEGYDSVATRRVSRAGEPPIRSFFARNFYKLMNKISKTELMDGARDYRLMNRKFVDSIISLQERGRFSKGIFGWVGYKTKWIEFENVERSAGETKWSFWKLVIYAIDGITAFSTAPLAISAVLGVIVAMLSFLALIFIIVRRLAFGDPVSGWASTVSIMLFCSGMQMLFIGVIGEYLSKVFTEVKNRPIYICNETNVDTSKDKDNE